MTRKRLVHFVSTLCLGLFSTLASAAEKPDVLFIAIDDLNDWVGCLGGHPQAHTPNIDRLAARGTLFTRAYCVAPACHPSRTAIGLGKRPSTTGVYLNERFQNTPDVEVTRASVGLESYFKQNGYDVRVGGKVISGTGFKRPKNHVADRSSKDSLRSFRGSGPLDVEDQELGDYQLVDWAAQHLDQLRDKPLFLAVGFIKPHLPLAVPRRWFELHPLQSVKVPDIIGGDLGDVPAAGVAMATPTQHQNILKQDEWKRTVQAYLAATSFVDAQIGRLLDAAGRRVSKRELIIVLWSDHGWHLGEKEHWQKFTLWEDATRVPLIVAAPGVAKVGGRCDRPVDLLNLYPTLIDLCGLPVVVGLEGASLVPLLKDPATVWDRPAMTTWGRGNHGVRSHRYRYIQYADGSEELYDHQTDPHEWNNLAADPSLATVKADLCEWLPKTEVPAPSQEEIERQRRQSIEKAKRKRSAQEATKQTRAAQ
jgi:arylsulfatase A-like enzyme